MAVPVSPAHVLLLVLGAAVGADAQPPRVVPYALELRRYRSPNCTGRGLPEQRQYLDRCAGYGADLPGTTYTLRAQNESLAQYDFFPNSTDCGEAYPRQGAWRRQVPLGECRRSIGDGTSAMHVWQSGQPQGLLWPCRRPGVCGHAFQACCQIARCRGELVEPSLQGGGAPDVRCGPCIQTYSACCAAAKWRGEECRCQIRLRRASDRHTVIV